MRLDTFSSIPSKDGPIVFQRGDGRAKNTGIQKYRKEKKRALDGGLREEEEMERGVRMKKLFVQVHLAPPPPQG